LGNINKKELITQTKMLDLYNKIIGRWKYGTRYTLYTN
jgi:hypothetical protein